LAGEERQQAGPGAEYRERQHDAPAGSGWESSFRHNTTLEKMVGSSLINRCANDRHYGSIEDAHRREGGCDQEATWVRSARI
jgi:hypothetical protein